MANSIALAEKFLPLLDEAYQVNSVTASLDSTMVDFAGGNKVNVFQTSMDGLGDYDRSTGFVKSDVTGTWEAMTLTQDRGRSFSIDAMDDEETLQQAFGSLSGEFIRTKVAPEVDAYRFAKYASAANILKVSTGAALTEDTTLAAVDAAQTAMHDAEVPVEGRILFITPTVYQHLKNSAGVTRFASMSDTALSRNFTYFDGMQVVVVPQSRFYTAIDLNDGTSTGKTAGGYAKGASAKDINFMIVHPTAVLQIAKHVKPRIFAPDVNQDADAWKFDYRIYHDAFVYKNKAAGIYLHFGA